MCITTRPHWHRQSLLWLCIDIWLVHSYRDIIPILARPRQHHHIASGATGADPEEEGQVPDESFTELVSERLVLRRFAQRDVNAFVAYRSRPDVARFQSWDAPY